ncbi:MAG: SPOR domain-containing protein, partial [Cryomorphaceae bacterium]
IQQNIQELESIAADKRQEADRFMFESDEPEVVVSDSQDVASAEAKTSKVEPEDTDILAVEDVVESLPDMDFLNLRYVSLNANVKYNSVKPGLDSAAALRSEIEEKVNQYEATKDAEEKRQVASEIRSMRAEMLDKERRITREIAASNQAELKYYSNSNKSLIRQLEVIGVMDGSDEAIATYKAQNAAIAERLNELQSPDKSSLTTSERIAEEQEIIASMAALYAEMDREIEVVEKQDSLLAANEHSANEIEERISPYETLLDNPDNLKPEPGRSYLAPIHTKVINQMSDARKAELQKNTDVLNLPKGFPDESDEAQLKSMVGKATPVDERGFEILRENPDQLQFLVSAIKADSLKEMEVVTKEFSEKMSADAREKYREVERLRNMASHESNPRNKQLVLERADALEVEANTNMERAALSSYQAERLRRNRLDEEENLAQLASKLSGVEIAETRALVDNKTYKIIPADLAFDELSEVPEKIEKQTAEKASQEDKSQDVAAEDLDLASEEEPVDEGVAVDSRANSSDEEKLMETAGTWLGMVEIIAERDNFSDVEESLFIEVDESVYSERKPIPINPTLPDGLFFQVQIGAFRNPIPQDLYGEIAPVMGEKLENGITRYRAGIFKNYGDAVASRNLIRSKGYSDAFVVAFVDGERLTGEQAQEILRQLRDMEAEEVADSTDRQVAESIRPEKAPELGESNAVEDRSVDYYSDPEAAVAKQVEVTPGLFYTVQVGVYSKPVKLAELFNLTDLNTELTESGYVRYTTGRYANLDNARSRKAVAVDKGVSDAFITAYYNGKRISIADAQAILEKEGRSALSPEVSENSGESPSPAESKEADVEKDYVVILGSFAGDIPQSLADLFLDNPDWEIKKVEGSNNQSMYIASDFQSKEEAKAFLKTVRDSGIQSAVLGELTNGQISAVGME